MNKNQILCLYLFFAFILHNTHYVKSIPHKGVFDSIKHAPKAALYNSDTKFGNLNNRKLANENSFRDCKMFLDLNQFNDQITEYEISDDRKEFYITGVKKAINTIESLLKVKIHDIDYYLSDIRASKYDYRPYFKSGRKI